MSIFLGQTKSKWKTETFRCKTVIHYYNLYVNKITRLSLRTIDEKQLFSFLSVVRLL